MIKLRIIITAVLICGALISYIALRLIRKKHAEDPLYELRQQERAAEYRRKLQEDKELEHMMSFSQADYDDDIDE